MKYRAMGALVNTDLVMDNLFWIGVYPGLTEEMMRYMLEKFGKFVSI
jgi:CDP-6-deoxy-D-xylo-4-hexulose-3-dehydrase